MMATDYDDPFTDFLLKQVHCAHTGGPTGLTGCLLEHDCRRLALTDLPNLYWHLHHRQHQHCLSPCSSPALHPHHNKVDALGKSSGSAVCPTLNQRRWDDSALMMQHNAQCIVQHDAQCIVHQIAKCTLHYYRSVHASHCIHYVLQHHTTQHNYALPQ